MIPAVVGMPELFIHATEQVIGHAFHRTPRIVALQLAMIVTAMMIAVIQSLTIKAETSVARIPTSSIAARYMFQGFIELLMLFS